MKDSETEYSKILEYINKGVNAYENTTDSGQDVELTKENIFAIEDLRLKRELLKIERQRLEVEREALETQKELLEIYKSYNRPVHYDSDEARFE